MRLGFSLNNIKIDAIESFSQMHVNGLRSRIPAECQEQTSDFIKTKKQVKDALESYLNANGEISGKKIMDDNFRLIKADIFISHSHKDIELAKKIADWLYRKFGLVSFVDSMIWKYSNDLLRLIDDKYCKSSNSSNYSYVKRNASTSYVHMMLAVSLMKMMEKASYFFFLNTEQSIKASEIGGKNETFSPWIFYELEVFHNINKQTSRIRVANESVQMTLPANTNLLCQVDINLLKRWNKTNEQGHDAINKLMELMRNND